MSARELVIKIREYTGLSQQALADRLGLYRSSVSQFETGARTPTPQHAMKYLSLYESKNLGISLEDFYSE